VKKYEASEGYTTPQGAQIWALLIA